MADNATITEAMRFILDADDAPGDRFTQRLILSVLRRAYDGTDQAAIIGYLAYRKRIAEGADKDACQRVMRALRMDRWGLSARVDDLQMAGEDVRRRERRERVSSLQAHEAWHMQQAEVNALIPENKRGGTSKGRSRREEKPGEKEWKKGMVRERGA